MTAPALAIIAISQLWVAFANAGCTSGPGDQAQEVHIASQSTLAALIEFGIENGVCLGIENPEQALLRTPVKVDLTKPTISYVIESLLGGAPYRVSYQDGVILIRNLAEMSRTTVLDVTLPEYVAKQKQSLATAEWNLAMALSLFEDRTAEGFAGTYSDRVPEDLVGPFDEHGRTVRDLLTLLVGQSTGAAWIAGHCSAPVKGRACWTILDYHDTRSALDGFLKYRIRDLIEEPPSK